MNSMLKFFRSIVRPRKDLITLLSHSPSVESPLSKRLAWIADLTHWILSESPLKNTDLDFSTGHPQAVRVKWLLHILEKHPEWEKNLSGILQSVFKETRIFNLLVLTGLQRQSGLFSEAVERIEKKLLPRAPDDENMEIFFSSTFRDEKDAHTVVKIDTETFEKVLNLFRNSSMDVFEDWKLDLREAISYISVSVSAQGSDPFIRHCLGFKTQRENAFFILHEVIEDWLKETDADIALVKKSKIGHLLQATFNQISQVYSHMDESGVSVGMVYKLERIDGMLRRLQMLIEVKTSMHIPSLSVQKLVASLIFESVRAKSLRALFADNAALIAKKITENSAETGEHYIARTVKEYVLLLKSAMGGGVATAGTTVVKFLIVSLPFSPFILGLLASINYSLSFLFIQLKHYTLATKQPAMTAASLADKIKENTSEEDLLPLTDQILHLVRSQVLAVCGNVVAVVPTMMAFCYIYFLVTGNNFIGVEKAEHVFHDFSILGPTPWYAAWTGVLLFSSSLIAGWFYHWVLFNKLPQALSRSEKLIDVVGPMAARKFGLFFRKNSSALAANISLGFFLGLVPIFGAFVGLPLDVRHVTLSSGALAAAAMAKGGDVIHQSQFWLAVLGVVSMGILNLTVSFSLALAVAIRAKKLPSYQIFWMMKSIGKKLLRSPLIWIVPPQISEGREEKR